MSAVIRVINSMLFNRCPRCHKGKVFKQNNPFNMKQMFQMNHHCDNCGEVYEREPGYFTGAMYVAYALTSGWFILWFILQLLVLDWPVFWFFIFVVSTVTVLAPLTFRWSRILWMNMFSKYSDKVNNDGN